MILHHRRTLLSVVRCQCPQSSPWEVKAPAEPKSTVSVQLSLFADNRSPGIPARPPFAHTKPQRGARLHIAQPFRGLITTQQS